MFALALVFVSKHFIEPMSLPFRRRSVRECGIMIDNEFFPAGVTAKNAHLFRLRHCRLLV
jgi:hypothetical protein